MSGRRDLQSRGERNISYLLQFAVPRADKRHRVAAVVVRRHRGHPVVFVDEEGGAFDGAGAPQWLIEVLAAEVVVYLQRLNTETERRAFRLKSVRTRLASWKYLSFFFFFAF